MHAIRLHIEAFRAARARWRLHRLRPIRLSPDLRCCRGDGILIAPDSRFPLTLEASLDYKRECPECHGAIEEGFILDRGHYNAANISSWVDGEPEKSFWTGIKTTERPQFRVRTWRCEKCGLLRSYADAAPL